MKAMKLIYLPLLVTFVTIIETTGEPCTTAGPLPVVNICTHDTKQQDDSDSVLIMANTTQNCICELSVINQNKAITVIIQKFHQETSSSPSAYGCGLILTFGIGTNKKFWEAQCLFTDSSINNSITINDKMTIKSFTVYGTLKENEGYCIQIKKKEDSDESGNQLELTCGISSTITTNTTQSVKKTTKMTKTTNPTTTTTTPKTTITVPTTSRITTTTIATTSTDTNELAISNITSTDSSVTTNKANQLKNKDNDDTITIGASVGGFVIIIVAIVMVCIYRRNYSKSASKPASKPGLAVNIDNDDYGLRENVLYVPADTTPIPINDNGQNTDRISVDIDGNYSTVDLDVTPSVEKSTGDNSSIDLVKLAPTESNMNESTNEKPVIAPKPKQKMTIQDDVYAVPDKKTVKHVTAPGEHGCEYAVVSKPNQSNFDKTENQPSASNVYAVVEKKKRMSDGKGTNQKRDSLTAENDGEPGQT